MDSVTDFAKLIGNLSGRIATLESNVYPDDPSAQLQLLVSEVMTFTEHGTIVSKLYPSTSFIIDHPVYGELDSSILQLDGGYASTSINQSW